MVALTAKRNFPTGGSAYGIAKKLSYSSIWKPGVARPSMQPSAIHTIGNTLVKLSSVNGDWGTNVSTLLSGVLDDEMEFESNAFNWPPNNSKTIKLCKQLTKFDHIFAVFCFCFLCRLFVCLFLFLLEKRSDLVKLSFPYRYSTNTHINTKMHSTHYFNDIFFFLLLFFPVYSI